MVKDKAVEKELTLEDEEFLEDINELDEEKQNRIIAYIKNRIQITAKATKEKVKNKYKSMYKQIIELRKENEELKEFRKIKFRRN